MADSTPPQPGPQQPAQTAFPLPPPFYKHFTPANLGRVRQLRDDQQSQLPTPDAAALRYLTPPPPPVSGSYSCFNDPYHVTDTLPSLSSSAITQLYPSPAASVGPPPPPSSIIPHPPTHPTASSLLLLSQSLLLAYLELVALLAHNPALYPAKLQDMRTIFLNIEHLINEYRPHQARESLAGLMKEEVERVRKETRGIREVGGRVRGVLEGVAGGLQTEERGKEEEERGEAGEERRVWDVLRRELGS